MRISIRAGLVAAAVWNRLRSFHHELATGFPIPGVPASSPGWPRRQVETTALLCATVDGPELSPRGVQLTPTALWALHARRRQVRELTLPCHAHTPSHRLTGFHPAQELGTQSLPLSTHHTSSAWGSPSWPSDPGNVKRRLNPQRRLAREASLHACPLLTSSHRLC